MEKEEFYNIFDNECSHFYYVGLHNALLKILKVYAPKTALTILDIGCGTGSFALKMASLGEVVGVDSSSVAIQLAKKRGLKKCQVGSALQIPLPDHSFEVVTAIDLLCQFSVEDAKVFLQEVRRVLKPGGIFVLRTAAHRWLCGSHDQFIHILSRYSKQGLIDLLVNNGFKIIKLSFVNFFVFIPVFLKRLLQRILKSPPSSDISLLPHWLNQILVFLEKMELLCLLTFGLPVGVGLLAVLQPSSETE